MNRNNDTLTENIRQVLDQSLEDLDASTRSRLTQARYLALERRKSSKQRLFLWGSIPAAGLTLLVLFLLWPSAPITQLKGPDIGELNILTSAEPLDFYQEEMEFYEWLSEVMETEKEFSGRLNPQSDNPFSNHFARPGWQQQRVAESGNAGIPGVI